MSKILVKATKIAEVGRKVLHIGTFGVLFIAKFYFNALYHLPVICGLAVAFTSCSKKLKLLKEIERNTPSFGEIYYSISLLVLSTVTCFYKELFPCLIIAFTALSLGDGFASVFGNVLPNLKIKENKTLFGTIACVLFTFLGLTALRIFSVIDYDFLAIITLSLCAGAFELIGKGLDNFSVPFSVFILSTFIYLFGGEFTISLLIATIVFFVAFLSKFITYYGALLASFIGFTFIYFGGVFPFLFLIGCYALMLTVNLIRKLLKQDLSKVVDKTGGKDFFEILVNGLFSTLAMILYGVFADKVFIIVSLICVSAGFTDSIASDVGTLSKKPPFDIFKRKFVVKGISGGVTVLGTISSLISALIFGLIIALILDLDLALSPLVGLICFSGCVVDTILGSLIQAKYRCPICGANTEKRVCCNNETVLYSGLKFVDNDLVNLFSSIVPFGLGFLFILCV